MRCTLCWWQAITNPQVISDALASNPAARHLMEQNPRLHQLMTDPDALRGMLSGRRCVLKPSMGVLTGQCLHTLRTASSRMHKH